MNCYWYYLAETLNTHFASSDGETGGDRLLQVDVRELKPLEDVMIFENSASVEDDMTA